MYELVYSKNVLKRLKKLDGSIRERIIISLERVRIRPEAHVTRLVGSPHFKFRVGDYRIIMDINKGKLLILIIKIAHRKNVYK